MKNKINSIFKTLVIVSSSIMLIQCNDSEENPVQETKYEETVVVANRASGSISFINNVDNTLLKTLPITNSEPMYIVYVKSKDKLYVGDRLGKKVHIINPQTKVHENSIPVGTGVFHMWAGANEGQLWVNNDIDNTISVIDLNTNMVVKTIDVGMKPHDVFITNDGSKAYISVLNSNISIPDKIFMYKTSDYTKTSEISVGKDPHLFHISSTNKLYVPCQSGKLFVLNGLDLSISAEKDFNGAHGIFPSPDNNFIFVSNISGSQIYTIKTSDNSLLGSAAATATATPHNLVVDDQGKTLYVTHSGATADKVSIYTINGGILTFKSAITTANNPFGITYYKRKL